MFTHTAPAIELADKMLAILRRDGEIHITKDDDAIIEVQLVVGSGELFSRANGRAPKLLDAFTLAMDELD